MACHESYADGPALVRAELEFAGVLANYAPTPAAFRFLRTVLRLKASELAALLAVAPETVSRWENDKRPIDSAAWSLLGSMLKDKFENRATTLERLRASLSTRDKAAPKRLVLRLEP